jgi:tryptophan halogenase
VTDSLERIAVLGNTPAAWVSAVFLKKRLNTEVVIVCPPAEESRFKVAQAETFTPELMHMHTLCGLQEQHWFLPSGASFQTATRVLGQTRTGEDIDAMLPFSATGSTFNGIDFHHYALKAGFRNLESHSLGASMARANKFVHPVQDPSSIFSSFAYGMAVDVAKYISLMVKYAQHLGVKVVSVNNLQTSIKDGMIEHVLLPENRHLSADLFIDASDEQSVQANLHKPLCTNLNSQDEILLASRNQEFEAKVHNTISTTELGILHSNLLPDNITYTLKYDSAQFSNEQAHQYLAKRTSNSPNHLPYYIKDIRPVQREDYWVANCVGIGEGLGNPCPDYFGSIELAIRDINRLIDIFPVNANYEINRTEYNRVTSESVERCLEYQHTFSLLISGTSKNESNNTQKALATKLNLFKARGHLAEYENDPIPRHAWINLFMYCGYKPDAYHALIESSDTGKTYQNIEQIKQMIALSIAKLPSLSEYRQKLSAKS